MSKYKLTYRAINIAVILVMFSHITFMHNLVQNYVLCFGSDGHIQIENVNDGKECANFDIIISTSEFSNTIIKNVDCEDIPLDDNCFEENQFISKNKTIADEDVLKTNTTTISPEKNHNLFYLDTNFTKNHILENYTSVSLII